MSGKGVECLTLTKLSINCAERLVILSSNYFFFLYIRFLLTWWKHIDFFLINVTPNIRTNFLFLIAINSSAGADVRLREEVVTDRDPSPGHHLHLLHDGAPCLRARSSSRRRSHSRRRRPSFAAPSPSAPHPALRQRQLSLPHFPRTDTIVNNIYRYPMFSDYRDRDYYIIMEASEVLRSTWMHSYFYLNVSLTSEKRASSGVPAYNNYRSNDANMYSTGSYKVP